MTLPDLSSLTHAQASAEQAATGYASCRHPGLGDFEAHGRAPRLHPYRTPGASSRLWPWPRSRQCLPSGHPGVPRLGCRALRWALAQPAATLEPPLGSLTLLASLLLSWLCPAPTPLLLCSSPPAAACRRGPTCSIVVARIHAGAEGSPLGARSGGVQGCSPPLAPRHAERTPRIAAAVRRRNLQLLLSSTCTDLRRSLSRLVLPIHDGHGHRSLSPTGPCTDLPHPSGSTTSTQRLRRPRQARASGKMTCDHESCVRIDPVARHHRAKPLPRLKAELNADDGRAIVRFQSNLSGLMQPVHCSTSTTHTLHNASPRIFPIQPQR